MKKILLAVLLLIQANFAMAESLNPCTPVVKLQPSYLSCKQGDLKYFITIDTWSSPSNNTCVGERYYESNRATIETSKGEVIISELTAYNGEFKYYFVSDAQGWTFKSGKFGFNIKNCISPMHNGGFSLGN